MLINSSKLFIEHDQIYWALRLEHVDKYLMCNFCVHFDVRKSWFWCCGVGIDGNLFGVLLIFCDHGNGLFCSSMWRSWSSWTSWSEVMIDRFYLQMSVWYDFWSCSIGLGFRFFILLLCFSVVGMVKSMLPVYGAV